MKLTSNIAPIVAGAVILSIATVAFAQTGAAVTAGTSVSAGGTNISANMQLRITKGKSRADQEVQRRIDLLNALSAKVQTMGHISASEKSDISATVSSQIASLDTLKAKIDADGDITTLRSDIQSIVKAYRIFMLIIPRGRIDVAADRINTVASSMTTFAAALQTRISAATGDTSALSASLSDMNAKVSAAQTQANASVSAVAALQPDNGDKTVETSNAAALKNARANLQAAFADLKTARQDAGTIVKALEQMNAAANASVHAAANASTSTQ